MPPVRLLRQAVICCFASSVVAIVKAVKVRQGLSVTPFFGFCFVEIVIFNVHVIIVHNKLFSMHAIICIELFCPSLDP